MYPRRRVDPLQWLLELATELANRVPPIATLPIVLAVAIAAGIVAWTTPMQMDGVNWALAGLAFLGFGAFMGLAMRAYPNVFRRRP